MNTVNEYFYDENDIDDLNAIYTEEDTESLAIWDDPEEIAKDSVVNKIDILKFVDNELMKLEPDRMSIEFYLDNTLVSAVPMAKLNDKNVVFKINNKLKKINITKIEM